MQQAYSVFILETILGFKSSFKNICDYLYHSDLVLVIKQFYFIIARNYVQNWLKDFQTELPIGDKGCIHGDVKTSLSDVFYDVNFLLHLVFENI